MLQIKLDEFDENISKVAFVNFNDFSYSYSWKDLR